MAAPAPAAVAPRAEVLGGEHEEAGLRVLVPRLATAFRLRVPALDFAHCLASYTGRSGEPSRSRGFGGRRKAGPRSARLRGRDA